MTATAPVATTASPESKRAHGLAFWLTVAARVLILAAFLVWLKPPTAIANPPLPESWTPGCAELEATWKVVPRTSGFGWIGSGLIYAEDDALYFQVFDGQKRRGFERLDADGGLRQWFADLGEVRDVTWLREDDKLIAAAAGVDSVGIYELDPLTMEERRRAVFADLRIGEDRIYFTKGGLQRLPDGSYGVVCTLMKSKRRAMVVVDPASGEFRHYPIAISLLGSRELRRIDARTMAVSGEAGVQYFDLLTGEAVTPAIPVEPWSIDQQPERRLRLAFEARGVMVAGLADAPGVIRPLAILRRTCWSSTLGQQEMSKRWAGRYRIKGISIFDDAVGIPLDDPDLLATVEATKETFVMVPSFKGGSGLRTLDQEVDTQMYTGISHLPTTDGRTVVMQRVLPSPSSVAGADGLLRFGLLEDAAVRWIGWVRLPHVEIADKQWKMWVYSTGDRWYLALRSSSSLSRQVGQHLLWCQLDPLPGIALPVETRLLDYPAGWTGPGAYLSRNSVAR